MAVLGSECMLESALAQEASLLRRRSVCLSESAIEVLLVVLRLAAGVESFWEFSLAALPILIECLGGSRMAVTVGL